MIARILDALEERTGARGALERLKRAPVRGGASWGYVLGTTTVALFGVLAATGAALAAFYAPSATDAWASIAYLEREIPLGALLRALHLHAHSALVIVMTLHLVRVVMWGAYRAPREATQLTGVILLVLVTAFSLTGYLLPFDQNAYWATKVRMGIVGGAPVVGELTTRLLLGGNDVGSLSLTRFFALHTLVLPVVFGLFLSLHLAFFRRHGATPRPSGSEAHVEPYFPRQAAFDAIAALVAIGLVLAVALTRGAPLEAPADPSTSYVARPEWYFLFLFQLLKYFHGSLDVLGKVVAPALALGFLVALPFLDRAPSRGLRDRRAILGLFALGLFGMSVLAGLAVRADGRDPALALQHRVTVRESERAKRLAADGVPPEGAAFLVGRDPLLRGERVFWRECASCHPLEGVAPKDVKAPELTGYLGKAWLRQVLRDPDSHRLYGKTKVYGMKPLSDATEAQLARIVEHLYALRQPSPPPPDEEMSALLDQFECGKCHEMEEDYGLEGPTLFRFGSEAWVRQVVDDAGVDHLYAKANTMPKFSERLSEADRAAVVSFVLSLEERAPLGAWPLVDEPAPTPREVPTSTVAE